MVNDRFPSTLIHMSAAVSFALALSACKKDDPSSPSPVPDGLTNNGWTRNSNTGENFQLGSGPTSLFGIVTEIEGGVVVPPTAYTATLLSSSNMGDTWTTTPLMSGAIATDEFALFGAPRFVDDQVGFCTLSHGSIWSPTSTIYRTPDGGQSWSALGGSSGSFARVGMTSRLFRYDGTLTYVSQNLGITWVPTDPALGHIASMVFTDDEHGSATGDQGILTTSDGGLSWQTMSNESYTVISHADPLIGVATRGPLSGPGELLRTTDGWVTSTLVQLPEEVGTPVSILLDGNGPLYACQEERLYISMDLGDTWSLDLEMTSDHNIRWVRRVGDHLVVATGSSSWARKLAPL